MLALLIMGCSFLGQGDWLEDGWPEGLRLLEEPSSGECPDLGSTGLSSFTSSGQPRRVSVVLPPEPGPRTQVVVFFHGLMTPEETTEPSEYFARRLELERAAEERDMLFLLPESGLRHEVGMDLYLWDVEGPDEEDLVLFDDLRACVSEAWSPDLGNLAVTGFSGGALFTTRVVSQRGDALGSFVELSGGADLDVPLSDLPLGPYQTPTWPMPALLWTGGEDDAFPSEDFRLADFGIGTDQLQEHLVADAHLVVRCDHQEGHTITEPEWTSALDWMEAHRFQEDSPYAGDLSSLPASCYFVEP